MLKMVEMQDGKSLIREWTLERDITKTSIKTCLSKKFAGSLKKQESSRKTSIFALLTMPKPLTVWITTNCGKFFKRWECQTTWPVSWGNLYAGQEATVRTRHGTTDWFQIGKRVHPGCILSPCLFNLYVEYIMRNAGFDEAQAGIKISRRNINNLRYGDYRKWRRTKEPLDESERRE